MKKMLGRLLFTILVLPFAVLVTASVVACIVVSVPWWVFTGRNLYPHYERLMVGVLYRVETLL